MVNAVDRNDYEAAQGACLWLMKWAMFPTCSICVSILTHGLVGFGFVGGVACNATSLRDQHRHDVRLTLPNGMMPIVCHFVFVCGQPDKWSKCLPAEQLAVTEQNAVSALGHYLVKPVTTVAAL
jgi:hypothetical protein